MDTIQQELFSSKDPFVTSRRVLYTPSTFARTSLLHLQEAGSLTALKPHVSARENLLSYLCFVVEDGAGGLLYDGKEYELKKGDCVFIDCRKAYSHFTSDNLWSLSWCHFYGPSLSAIYDKYQERGGLPVFHPEDPAPVLEIFGQICSFAESSDYIRDMRINQTLDSLLTWLMSHSWHPENAAVSKKRMELSSVKQYLDEHYTEKIVLDDLVGMFYIDKYYLTKIFKETYGMTITAYLLSKRITKAKSLLRFTNMTMDEISAAVGMNDANYFARSFKKIVGLAPSGYRRSWGKC